MTAMIEYLGASLKAFFLVKFTPTSKTAAYWNTNFEEIHYKVRNKEKVHLSNFQCFPVQSALSANKLKGQSTWWTAQGIVAICHPRFQLVPITLIIIMSGYIDCLSTWLHIANIFLLTSCFTFM